MRAIALVAAAVVISAAVPRSADILAVRDALVAAAVTAGCAPIPATETIAQSRGQAAASIRLLSRDGPFEVEVRCEVPMPGDAP